MKIASAYYAGAKQALDAFDVRVAADLTGQGMPDGPPHLGAEWLARRLRDQPNEDIRVGTKPSHKPLERPPRWGPRSSLESGAVNARNTGMSSYGGV